MAIRIDVERNEIRALKEVTDWRGKQVLEIGCGSGRLTRRLARLGANIQAIRAGCRTDPNRPPAAAEEFRITR